MQREGVPILKCLPLTRTESNRRQGRTRRGGGVLREGDNDDDSDDDDDDDDDGRLRKRQAEPICTFLMTWYRTGYADMSIETKRKKGLV